MNYLLLFNKRTREFNIARLIEKQINSVDFEARVLTVFWDEPQNNICTLIDFQPNIVLTFPFTIADIIEVCSLLKCQFSCKICTITTEGFRTKEGIVENAGFYEYPADLIDEYFFFGPEFEQVFCEYIKGRGWYGEKARSISVGYPLYEWDVLDSIVKMDGDVYKADELTDGYERIVLVLSGFAEADINVSKIEEVQDLFDANKSNPEQKQSAIDFVLRARKYRKKYYNNIAKLAEEMQDVLFLLKLHPVEVENYNANEGYDFADLMSHSNIRIVTYSISSFLLLKRANVLLHYGSTVSVEAYLLKIPSVCVDGYMGEIFPSDLLVNSLSSNELRSFIEGREGIRFSKERDDFCYNYFGYSANERFAPSEKIAKELYLLSGETAGDYATFVDNGYYRKLRRMYILMMAKRIVLFKWKEAKEYARYIRYIQKVLSRYE